MKPLRVAVGITGTIVVLEKFPDDEDHAGLNEMLVEFEENQWDSFCEQAPGVYKADFDIEPSTADQFGESENFLYIDKLTRIE